MLLLKLGVLVHKHIEFPVKEMGEVVSVDGFRRTKATNVYRARALWWAGVNQSDDISLAKVIDNRRVTFFSLTHILLEAFQRHKHLGNRAKR